MDHREWDGEAAELEKLDGIGLETKTVMGMLVIMSYMDDQYLLGHNSRSVGISSWSIVRGQGPMPSSSRVESESAPAGDGEIHVTVEVST